MVVAMGAWLQSRREHQRWLRDQKLHAAIDFIGEPGICTSGAASSSRRVRASSTARRPGCASKTAGRLFTCNARHAQWMPRRLWSCGSVTSLPKLTRTTKRRLHCCAISSSGSGPSFGPESGSRQSGAERADGNDDGNDGNQSRPQAHSGNRPHPGNAPRPVQMSHLKSRRSRRMLSAAVPA
jgi:hypothetical protein